MTSRITRIFLCFLVLFTAQGAARASRRFALLITSGDYAAGVPMQRLPGVRNDAALMLTLLRSKLDVSPGDIEVIGVGPQEVPHGASGCSFINAEATRDTIRKGFSRLQQKLDRFGGSGIIYYTGHGGSIPDNNRVHRSTQYWIDRNGSPVFDFEIHEWLRKMEAHPLTLLFDCCYSSGMAREYGFGISKASPLNPPQVRSLLDTLEPAAERQGLLDDDLIGPRSRHVLFSASSGTNEAVQAIMLSYGAETQVSAFTLALYRQMMKARRALSLTEMRDSVMGELRSLACRQVPDLQGNQRDSGFGDIQDSSTRIPVEKGSIPMGIQMGVTTGTILQGVNGSSLEGPLLRVTQAGPLFSSVAPVKSGTPLPTMVTTLSSAAPQRKNGYRVPIIIRKGGADEPKEPFQDEHVDWIVNMSIPASGNKYRIQASSHDGLTGPAYTASSEGEARRKAEELQQWLEVMGVLRNYQNPLHPMGLQLKTEQGLAPSYLIGKEFNVSVFTEKTGYLLLLGLEQNGKMDVFYPNQKSGEFRLEPGRSVNLPLAAAEPAGETTVVAFISTHPLSPPEDLLEPGGGGGIHWIVMPEKRTEFLRWLSEALHRTVADAPAATRDLITPASGAALATSFDVQTLVVRVREPEREQ